MAVCRFDQTLEYGQHVIRKQHHHKTQPRRSPMIQPSDFTAQHRFQRHVLTLNAQPHDGGSMNFTA
ncbi:hypothetical protein AF72_05505 [Xylella taiwanensis]|uniref:Uncharacterized protein n=1 Tax=Xylella taiwanensis TaxID=1444770 RepID=Z9JKZ3_9GAMM|nr:hypothetical protein AB672_02780 [Xylella taiwanensis]EWS78496.1 hypothetical protein AF72_05505 [Xylella taiwanensis]